ncbi:ABC transporter transmembrane domain-containing protein, partial [Escherichia coli]|uniref:ABC transporter transmembrane domain-containing protein n=1 Tax=Escherichia coli TaxID=562 RepID=UPI00200DC7F3
MVSFLSSTVQYAGLLGMGEKIAIYLRSEMFEALLRRDMGFFDDEKNSVGSLTTALADDCRLVNRAFSESFARQMQALCNL